MGCRPLIVVGLVGLLAGISSAADKGSPSPSRPNVLLICVDELRCELGCYGVKEIQTPHLDLLAREGRRVERHYVQVAACGPSRCTLLTGYRENRSWDV